MHSILPGVALIETDESVSLASGENRLTVNREITTIKSPNAVTIDSFGGVINLVGPIQTLDVDGNVGWAKTQDITVTTPLGNQTLSFVNGLLIDQVHYTFSGFSTCGSGVTPPAPSGSVTFLQSESWNFWDGKGFSPSFGTYEGNGIVQSTPFSSSYDTTVSWIFRITYSGATSEVGEVLLDWEHLSGNCRYNPPSVSGFTFKVGKAVGSLGTYYQWANVNPVADITPDLLSWMTGSTSVVSLLSSGSLVDNLNQIDGRILPDLEDGEDRWLLIHVEATEVISTCQWKIKKLYVRPPGTSGGSDIIIWENA